MENLRFFRGILFSLVITAGFSCNHHSESTQKNKPSVLKFNRHELVDRKGTGMVAATYLVPQGWDAQDVVEWNINKVAQPATAELFISDKKTNSSLQGFPGLVFLVNTDADWNEKYPEGSTFWNTEVLNQKPGVIDLIKNYIIPQYRNISGLKIIESKNLSLAQSNHKRAAEFKNTDSKSGVVKIEYTEKGKTFEETIYGTITYLPVSKYQLYVYLSMCYGCKAEKGRLKSTMGIFETILNSVKMNPKWAVTYKEIAQLAMQNAMRSNGNGQEDDYNESNYGDDDHENGYGNNAYGDNRQANGYGNRGYSDNYKRKGYDNSGYQENQQANGYGNDNYGNYNRGISGGTYNGGNSTTGNIGNLSNYIEQANESVNDGMIQNYENQQLSNDRIAEGYSDYIRDYQNYTDPNSGEVYKLSSGYNNAWTDNNGSVIMSNDAGYDPNVGGTSTWSSLDVGGSTVSSPAAVSTEPSE